jgi:nucleotide-binding universal stress UspA family protein
MRRVLVGIEEDTPPEDLARALSGLKDLGVREVVLAHVKRPSPVPLLHKSDPTGDAGRLLARARMALEGEFQVELSLLMGTPAQELAQAAQDREAQLIVLPSFVGEPTREGLRASTAWEVVRRARLPVLMVPVPKEAEDAQTAELTSGRKLTWILHPSDLSAVSDRALPIVRELAVDGALPVTLLHVREDPGEGEPEGPNPKRRLQERVAELAESGVEEVQDAVEAGEPWKSILAAAARRKGCLTVMATQGLGFLPELVFGSQSRKVLRHAVTPLLLVPPGVDGRDSGAGRG